MDIVQRVTQGRTKAKNFPKFNTGDTVGVYVKVKEGEKERVQLYRGVVMHISGSGMGRSFTVRKISSGVGVERTFPFTSPAIDRVEVISHGKVRRARLFYLRDLKGRAARLDSELALESENLPGAADEIVVESKEGGQAQESAPVKAKKEKKADKPAKDSKKA